MLIALSGGSPAQRERIAARLIESGKARLQAYVQHEPKASHPYRRAHVLRAALEQGGHRGRQHGLVVVHCLTEQEAVLVREQGGVLWHLYSRPSARVVIRAGDCMVVDDDEGEDHIRAPLEALSELLLANERSRPAKACLRRPVQNH